MTGKLPDASFNRVGQVAEMTTVCGMRIQRIVSGRL
jgi:hypothetical protein